MVMVGFGSRRLWEKVLDTGFGYVEFGFQCVRFWRRKWLGYIPDIGGAL